MVDASVISMINSSPNNIPETDKINELAVGNTVITVIAYTKKYLQSDWLRGEQYWPYLYSVFNICTLWLNKKKNATFEFRSEKIEMYSLKTN